jgi:hypothetical protein
VLKNALETLKKGEPVQFRTLKKFGEHRDVPDAQFTSPVPGPTPPSPQPAPTKPSSKSNPQYSISQLQEIESVVNPPDDDFFLQLKNSNSTEREPNLENQAVQEPKYSHPPSSHSFTKVVPVEQIQTTLQATHSSTSKEDPTLVNFARNGKVDAVKNLISLGISVHSGEQTS